MPCSEQIAGGYHAGQSQDSMATVVDTRNPTYVHQGHTAVLSSCTSAACSTAKSAE